MEEKLKVIMVEAQKAGFSETAVLDSSTIKLMPEVRDMCAANTCGQYGKNWSCPPGCGSLEDCEKKVREFDTGVIVQTVGTLEDSMDYEGMQETVERHNKQFKEFAKYLQEHYKKVLSLGSGCCTICETCTYPDAPCRFPEKNISSMESYGMLVSEVCKLNNIKYYYGPETICYVGCYLIED